MSFSQPLKLSRTMQRKPLEYWRLLSDWSPGRPLDIKLAGGHWCSGRATNKAAGVRSVGHYGTTQALHRHYSKSYPAIYLYVCRPAIGVGSIAQRSVRRIGIDLECHDGFNSPMRGHLIDDLSKHHQWLQLGSHGKVKSLFIAAACFGWSTVRCYLVTTR